MITLSFGRTLSADVEADQTCIVKTSMHVRSVVNLFMCRVSNVWEDTSVELKKYRFVDGVPMRVTDAFAVSWVR